MKSYHRFFAFIPWPLFLTTNPANLTDLSKIQVALSKDAKCSEISAKFLATVARSESAKAKGLSNRTNLLKANEAMLFYYETPQTLTFWMKETYIPLQILFFNPRGELLKVAEMPVESTPLHPKKLYSSTKPASVAIELNAKTIPTQSSNGMFLCMNPN